MGEIEFVNFGKGCTSIAKTCESAISQWRLSTQARGEATLNRMLFLIELDSIGENHAANDFLRSALAYRAERGCCAFTDSLIALVVVSPNTLYTKTFTKKFLFLANALGAEIMGHPLVELTEGYANLRMWSQNLNLSLEETAKHLIYQTVERLGTYRRLQKPRINLLVLHAGHQARSNTLMLWGLVEEKLTAALKSSIKIKTLHVEDGQIRDCFGCSYQTCTYHALGKSCFYGGFVVEELFPEIEKADYIVWICPNYNDALSAKLMAVINRLTALYRSVSFRDKYIASVVVSANSGSDTVAAQLVGALCVNKGFRVPPYHTLIAQANAPGEILKLKTTRDEAEAYFKILYKNLNNSLEKSENCDIIKPYQE
ncbi:flavodoxin family protein [Fusibacter sp. JL298sf-3]